MSTRITPNRSHVQRLIVWPYPLQCCRHFILRSRDRAEARDFISTLVTDGWITDASLSDHRIKEDLRNGKCPLNIGFTFAGLQAIGVADGYLRLFKEKAPAFAEGASLRAARRLADTGASAAERWERPFKHQRAHVLLTLHANDSTELGVVTNRLRARGGDDAFDGWDEPLDAEHLSKPPKRRTVHFGFADGISNPRIKGFHDNEVPHGGWHVRKLHEPGEFLLGYANDSGFNQWLLINPSASPNPWLPPLAAVTTDFFRDGSFAALRKMEQHEKEFRESVALWAKGLGVEESYVRAKICGRWADGSVVTPDQSTPSKNKYADDADLDDFDFKHDREGKGCPFGSHIRRMNPRDDHVVPVRRRPLLRRGMPYGKAYTENEQPQDRGLLGLFFCASLEDQFEHLLAEWGDFNPMGPPNRGNAKDPFIGSSDRAGAVFDIPVAGEKLRQLRDFRSFVTARGTAYAFFPGLSGLKIIAHGKEQPLHARAARGR
jgi:deferrochelatase/peroxidase EfeB